MQCGEILEHGAGYLIDGLIRYVCTDCQNVRVRYRLDVLRLIRVGAGRNNVAAPKRIPGVHLVQVFIGKIQ
jgi:hypothetical protein